MKSSRLNPFLAVLLLAPVAHASDQTWNNGGPTNYWNTADLNWDAGTPWIQNNSAIFGNTGETVTLTTGINVGGLTFNSGGYTLNGHPLTLAGGGVINTGADNATINCNLTSTGSIVKSGSGSLTLGGSGASISGGLIISQGSVRANHESAFGVTQTVTLGDSNSGSGAAEFLVDSGVSAPLTLASISNSSFGSSQTITINTGSSLWLNNAGLVTTLKLDGSVPVTIKATQTGTIHGTAQDVSLRIEGSGIAAGTTALVLDGTAKNLRISQLSNTSAASNFTGDVLIKGEVNTQNRSYLGQTANNQNLSFLNNDVTVSEGAIWGIVWGGETTGALNGSGTVRLDNQNALNNIGLTMGNNHRDGSFTGTMGSSWGVAKTGTGTQELAGSGITYSGTTTLTNGTLKLTKTNAWNSNITVNTTNAVTLQLNSADAADSWSLAKQVTGGSANAMIEKVGPGTVILNPAAGSSFRGTPTGALTVTAGKLYLNRAFTTAPAVSVASGATFGGTSTAGNVTVANTGTIEGGMGGSGTLRAANVTLGSGATDTATIKGGLSTTAGHKAIAVTNLTLNGGDRTVMLDATGAGLVNGAYYDLLVSTNAISAPNATSVTDVFTSNARAYTPNVDGTGTKVQLYYDANASIYWTGGTSTEWGVNNNFKLSGNHSDTLFMANDVVYFNDDPVSDAVVISNGDVTPQSTNFTNSTATTYSLEGRHGIASGLITKSGDGTLVIGNSNSTTGAVALNGGTVSIWESDGLGSGGLTMDGGSLEYHGPATTWTRSLTVNPNGGTVVVDYGTSLSSTGALSGSGTLVKDGPGTLTLGQTSGTATANLRIDAGTLSLDCGTGDVTYTGSISGSDGVLRLDGTGASSSAGLTLAGHNSFSGETHLYGRRIFLDNPTGNAIGGDIVIKQGNWPYHGLTLNRSEQIADTAVIRFEQLDDAYDFRLNGNTETVAGIQSRGYGQGSFGYPGTWCIIENAGYDGGNDNYIPTGALIVAGSGDYVYHGQLRDMNGGTSNSRLNFSKSGTGTQTLIGNGIKYTGLTTIDDGRLVLRDATAFASIAVLLRGGTLELEATAGAWTFAQPITSGAGDLVKSGDGTVTLTALSVHSGRTIVNGGTLALGSGASIYNTSAVELNNGNFSVSALPSGYQVSTLLGTGSVTGSIAVASRLAIGASTGTMYFQNLTLGAGATAEFEVTGGGTAGDLGNVSGRLNLNGASLTLLQLGTYTPDQKYTLFAYNFGDLLGTFADLSDGEEFIAAGGSWKIDYDDLTSGLNGGVGNRFVTVTSVPEPGAITCLGLAAAALFRRRRSPHDFS